MADQPISKGESLQPLANDTVESESCIENENETPSTELKAATSEPSDSNEQLKSLETHANHLHKAPGNGWKHYLFEFFMLFLAVFCGFLAEYQLEHRIDRERVRKYMKSMRDDLRKDTSNFNDFIDDGKQVMSIIDSLIFLLQSPSKNFQTSEAYYLARRITLKMPTYEIFDRTYSQMKSSGNLRLLESQMIADGISSYYFDITVLSSQQNYISNFLLDYTKKVAVVFDASVFHQMYLDAGLTLNTSADARNFPELIRPPDGDPQLASASKNDINSLVGTLHYLYARILSTNSNIRNQHDGAIKLMEALEEEYRLN